MTHSPKIQRGFHRKFLIQLLGSRYLSLLPRLCSSHEEKAIKEKISSWENIRFSPPQVICECHEKPNSNSAYPASRATAYSPVCLHPAEQNMRRDSAWQLSD